MKTSLANPHRFEVPGFIFPPRIGSWQGKNLSFWKRGRVGGFAGLKPKILKILKKRAFSPFLTGVIIPSERLLLNRL
jgi:hypothetical protein